MVTIHPDFADIFMVFCTKVLLHYLNKQHLTSFIKPYFRSLPILHQYQIEIELDLWCEETKKYYFHLTISRNIGRVSWSHSAGRGTLPTLK